MTVPFTEAVEALKPCPFCGGAAVAHPERRSFKSKVFWVACMSSKCAMAAGEHQSREQAIKAWNTRT